VYIYIYTPTKNPPVRYSISTSANLLEEPPHSETCSYSLTFNEICRLFVAY